MVTNALSSRDGGFAGVSFKSAQSVEEASPRANIQDSYVPANAAPLALVPNPIAVGFGGKRPSASEFVERLGASHITLAFDDGSVHRIDFTTNSYGVQTAAYAAVGQGGQLEPVHGAQHMPVKHNLDGTLMVLKGERNSDAGTFKHDFKVMLPLSYDFLDTRKGLVAADLRWGTEQTARGFIETD